MNPTPPLVSRISTLQWVGVVFVCVLAINGLANVLESLRKIYNFFRDIFIHFRGPQLEESELKAKAIQAAQKLIDFAEIRQQSEPPFEFQDFEESAQKLSQYSTATNSMYLREHFHTVSTIRDELLKKELTSVQLDRFFEHPTNYIGYRMVAAELLKLAGKLK